MPKTLINFIVVLLAVLLALFLYDKFRATRTTGDFGISDAQMNAQIVRSDLSRASSAKTAVAEYHAYAGKWPNSNEEVGLPAPDAFRRESLRSLVVAGPVITMTFDARSGLDGGQILLTGDASNPAMGATWKCTSPDFKAVATILRWCTYDGD